MNYTDLEIGEVYFGSHSRGKYSWIFLFKGYKKNSNVDMKPTIAFDINCSKLRKAASLWDMPIWELRKATDKERLLLGINKIESYELY